MYPCTTENITICLALTINGVLPLLVYQSYPTLLTPIDCSHPDHRSGINTGVVAIPTLQKDLPTPGIDLNPPALQI